MIARWIRRQETIHHWDLELAFACKLNVFSLSDETAHASKHDPDAHEFVGLHLVSFKLGLGFQVHLDLPVDSVLEIN